MGKYTLIISLVLGVFCNFALGRYSGGTGEPNDPYRIATPNDLNDIRNHTEDYNDCFILVNDINMAGFTYTTAVIAADTDNSNGVFEGTVFSGVFDGNDYIISNLLINDEDAGNDFLGLFGQIYGGTVQNLGIQDCNIAGGNGSQYIGTVCGIQREGTIENCYSTGDVTGYIFLGGLCGGNWGGTIVNCYGEGFVTGDGWVIGCLCGSNSGAIDNCYSTGTVTGGDVIGGLCGTNEGTIDNSYSEGSVFGGDISYGLGGFCGINIEGAISNCYATGTVTGGENSGSIGGLIGMNGMVEWPGGPITNCYATGPVDGNNFVGGLAGEDYDGEYTDCFWDSEVNPDVNGIGDGTIEPNVMGRTTAEMQTKSTFTDYGWDFVGESINGPNDVWTIKEGVKYPEHIWPMVQFVDWDGVDLADYSYFSDWWMAVDCGDVNDCNSTDLDYSGAVDANDLDIFSSYWLFGKQG